MWAVGWQWGCWKRINNNNRRACSCNEFIKRLKKRMIQNSRRGELVYMMVELKVWLKETTVQIE